MESRMENHLSVVTGDVEIELSSRLEEESVTPSPTPAAAAGSSITKSMEKLDNHPSVVTGDTELSVRNEADPFPAGAGFIKFSTILGFMIPTLMGFAALKYENKNPNALDTHPFFANMAVVAYSFAVVTSMTLGYIENSTKQRPVYYKILKCVLCLSAILSPLSIVMLFIPRRLNWNGYSTMVAFFGFTITYYFTDYKKLFHKNDASTLEANQPKESSLHCT